MRIPVEKRFPVDLAVAIAPIDALYQEAKRDIWSPDSGVPWSAFDPSLFAPAELAAARLVWSRRAWLEYTGIAATPALLIRFCLERGREVDAKYFLTVRNTEEAELVEAFHRYAQALGGYHDRPGDPAWEAVFNRGSYRDALNAEVSLDAYVAVHCAVEAGLELALYRAYLDRAREKLARTILARSVEDKSRNAEFGWRYLQSRASQFGDEEKRRVVAAIAAWIEAVEFSGYHVASLSSTVASGEEQRAQALAASAGLGAASAVEEEEVLRAYLSQARALLLPMGLSLPRLRHPRLGEL